MYRYTHIHDPALPTQKRIIETPAGQKVLSLLCLDDEGRDIIDLTYQEGWLAYRKQLDSDNNVFSFAVLERWPHELLSGAAWLMCRCGGSSLVVPTSTAQAVLPVSEWIMRHPLRV